MTSRRPEPVELLVAGWGVLGVLALLGQALWRLTPIALQPLREGGLDAMQAALYGGWVVFNAYAEGYRGFQRGFSPRVVARAIHLGRHRRPLHVLLAPAYCMCLFHASRRARIVAWSMIVLVTTVVVLVRRVPQPWRGIIDAGVVVGLAWGAAALVIMFAGAVMGRPPVADPRLPEHA